MIRRNAMPPGVLAATTWLALILAVAIFADLLRPYGITAMDLRARLTAPVLFGGGWAHALGTDELGRDVLSRLMVSIQMSLRIAFGATVIAAVFGTTMGFLAAHFRGWPEQIVLGLIDFQASMPFLILALSVPASPADWPSPPMRRAMLPPCANSGQGRRGFICAMCSPTSHPP